MMSLLPYAIGVDLGATKIAAALVGSQGEILAERRAATLPQEGPKAVAGRIAALCRQLLAPETAPQGLSLAGIGIGMPGLVDAAAGVVRNAVNLGWDEAPLAQLVHDALAADLGFSPVQVRLDNDTNVQALGEYIFGAAQDCDPFVYIGIGSGLGSGVFVNGGLLSGANHTAAELGHLVVDPAGRRCGCGLHGCVETVVSGPGLVATTQAWLARGDGPATQLLPEGLTAETVVAAAQGGDPLALAACGEAARWLGVALAAAVIVLNPARLVIGGGLGLAAYDLLVPGALAELKVRALAQSHDQLQVARAQVGSSAVGAAALIWHRQKTGVAA
jgi:glucokinase